MSVPTGWPIAAFRRGDSAAFLLNVVVVVVVVVVVERPTTTTTTTTTTSRGFDQVPRLRPNPGWRPAKLAETGCQGSHQLWRRLVYCGMASLQGLEFCYYEVYDFQSLTVFFTFSGNG